MGRHRPIAAALDQITWGLPAFIGLTGFNFSGFVKFAFKTLTDYNGSYNIKIKKKFEPPFFHRHDLKVFLGKQDL